MPALPLAELRGFGRLAFGIPRYLRTRITYDEADRQVREGVAARSERFLAKLAQVLADARSPYGKLFGWAGCELGDISKLVASDGVEAALEAMRRAGIYVTWEELKGRQPIKRGNNSLDVTWRDFNNPFVRGHFYASTGGTTGPPTRVAVDLENDAQSAPDWAVMFAAHDWTSRPLVFWTPGHVGVASRFLKCAKFGKDLEKWFVMARMTALDERLRSSIVHAMTRFWAGWPSPEYAPLTDAGRVLAYLLQRLNDGAKPVVNTSPSAAALLASLAQERGISLEGVSFLLGAEAVTQARWRTILASGARAVATYGTSECGWIGGQFPDATEPDEVRVFSDAYAVIADATGEGPTGSGQPLLLTNLRPAATKVLINAGIGDTAVIERGCGGPAAERFGYDVRLHTIRSFRKVTVWGTTFAVADLDSLIEEFLPSRFGGKLTDYQLIEREDDRGTPELRLLVDPGVGPLDPAVVADIFLTELARRRSNYGFMAQEIRTMDSLVVERRRPQATARGKVLPVITRRAS
jgi:hypothetical protein